jgi:toxin ParE1/3/4
MKVSWTHTAARHLEAIQDYIAQDNPAAAHKTVQKIRQYTEMLEQYPYSGKTGRVEGTRELVIPEPPYIIAYTIMGDTIAILAVLHHSRKWPEAF